MIIKYIQVPTYVLGSYLNLVFIENCLLVYDSSRYLLYYYFVVKILSLNIILILYKRLIITFYYNWVFVYNNMIILFILNYYK